MSGRSFEELLFGPLAGRDGFGDVADPLEPDVAWGRGEAGYRA